jgi:hypothetical protein
MITGDHAGTAAAIGKQIGLENPDRVLTGARSTRWTTPNWPPRSANGHLRPHQSRAQAAPRHGLAVAGHHRRDDRRRGQRRPGAEARRCGHRHGPKGSEAAKEAAELVLADDNFASIVAAVREGRTVYDNIKKVISWTLPTNAGEAMTIIVALLFGMTLPITPIQILWVNLITAVTLGIALAFEPTEENTMRRPPRPRDEPLLTWLRWLADRAGLRRCSSPASSASSPMRSTAATHRPGAHHGAEHARGDGDRLPVLRPQHLRHLADLEGGPGDENVVWVNGDRGDRGAVRR